MNSSLDADEFLDALGSVLIRAFWIGAAVLVLWFLMIALAGGFVHAMHSNVFPMTEESFYILHYAGMGILKILIMVFLLFPWIGIQMRARRED